jgi:hypothetical protein
LRAGRELIVRLLGPALANGQRIELEGLTVRLRVNPRARRLIVRLDLRSAEAVAVAPTRAKLGAALAFARERRPWLVDRMAAASAQINGSRPIDPASVRRLRREAQSRFEQEAERHCAALGIDRPPIRLSNARTRWGSCSPARGRRGASIRLSWRLALAPEAVADYVVAHECAHLIEANHGGEFWRLVRGLIGDPDPHRRWLRTHGPRLHAVAL